MTSSNKARRYLQNQKQHSSEPNNNSSAANTQFLIVDSTSSMRKFHGKTQQIPIPQITVQKNNDDDDDEHEHVRILNEFDQVSDNEYKHASVLRTTSLYHNDNNNEHMQNPLNQQRSFSFALGSQTNLAGEKHDDDDNDDEESIDILPLKTVKLAARSKSSLSKERFSRLFHSLTFRSGSHLMSKISIKRPDCQQQQHPCLACRNYPYLDLIPKSKKRPSIFGVLAHKLNYSITNENTLNRCSVCKRILSKSISTNEDNHQTLSTVKILRDQKQLYANIKRRQSLPSLFHHLLESSSSHRPSISSTFNSHIIENLKQSSAISSSTSSLTDSNHSDHDETTTITTTAQLNDKFGNKDEDDNEIFSSENNESHDLNSMHSNDSIMLENNANQQFLHPPEEKPRNLLVNVFRARRSNASLTSNEVNMVGKQFSVSVLNLASSFGTSRRNSAIATVTEPTVEQRKHALSEENLPSMDNTYIYFTNINGQNFKEKLVYSTISEETTLKEMLIKLFEKYNLSIDTHQICLRSAPTLPLSLNQPVKHLFLNDLIVTDLTNQVIIKSSAGKERNEKRNSTGSAILPHSKSTSKRLSTHCMMIDNDENHRTNKSNRSSIFTSSIFTRDCQESTETNLTFIRRKCDEWLIHGLPKLAQLQSSIDECDLVLEKEWQPYLNEQARNTISEIVKLQQETIYEMFSTEVSYIRQILTMTDVFMTSINILKSSQREGIFHDIDMDKLFSNIQEVLQGNLLFWKENFLPIKNKLIQTGLPMNPSDLKKGFLNFDTYFKPYLRYVLDQKTSAEYFKQRLARDELFQYLITWIEANFTNRLSFADLTIKPLQRLTRYKLLLEAIQKKTQDVQEKNDLHEMIQKVATFVNRVNSKLHKQEQEERIRQIQESIGPYEYVSAPPELTSILQEYNRDSISNRLDLLQDLPLHIPGYRRQLIQQGPMKMKDAKNNQDVYCYLFTDMFLITKSTKRNNSTNSSTSLTNNDGQYLRTSSNIFNKILKLPIRIDRFDVREYDRRTGNSEPNTASFVALVFSEYNLIESGYLFQTNLSKQWIENIRQTKANFQSLIEESKLKFQHLNHPISPSSISVSTNTIHQSLQSLTSPSFDLPILKIDELTSSNDNDDRRSPKIESDVFKCVEQTRRNSRIDRKNFGRYFTADGTSTHTSNSSPSSIKQISSSSTTILKRMSWNNEGTMDKTDSSATTNSFRSVHSSSGVSSTGSFLFSTDEESAQTSSSIPSIVPSTVIETEDKPICSSETSSSSLRRTPYTSIKKRSRQKLSTNNNNNDHHSSTHTIINQSSKSFDDTSSSLVASGNESDYDNNQSPIVQSPVNDLFHSDDLVLGDQNEIILHNDTHIDNQQSDSKTDDYHQQQRTDLHSTATLDDSVSTNFLSYQKDPLIARRLLDIRSHLLLNTTLDATEV